MAGSGAGTLDQRVKILRRELGPSASGSGQEVEEFVLVADVYAQIEPLRGSEGVAATARFAEATHKFRIRWRATLTTEMRLEWRGQQYDILEALPAGQRLREWLDILATASPAENPEG